MVELEERHLDDLQIDETSENGQRKSSPAGASKDSKNKVVEADPSDFQRVRLVSEKRPPAPSPAPKMARYSQIPIAPWKDPRASTLEERHLDDLQIDETSENGQRKSSPAGGSKDSKNKVVEADPSEFQRVILVSEKRPLAPSPAPKMARYSQISISPWKDPKASTLTFTKRYQPGSPSSKHTYRRLIVPPPAIFTHPGIIQLSDSSEDEEDEDEEDEGEFSKPLARLRQ